ncbi:MAG: hypothetical protein M3Y07_00860 [Acidobacteriota bacterium]|nr:hypothetical protein [Acidobacteriota bacterium]
MIKYAIAALATAVLFSTGAAAQIQMLTNYQLVSVNSLPNAIGKVTATYKADLVNMGAAEGAVVAQITTQDPFNLRIVPNQGVLIFSPVKANSVTTSKNTFSVLVDPTTLLDPTKLQVSFANGAAAPIANPGPNLTVPVGSTVTLDGTMSSDPSGGGGQLTYFFMFVSRPPGTMYSRIFYEQTPVAMFVPDAPGVYLIQLTVSNRNGSSTSIVSVTAN